MTLLSTVQNLFVRRGMPKPAFVVSNTDTTVLQCWGMAQEIVEDVVRRCVLQSMLREATFLTVAAESQGSINTIAPNGFYAIKDDTIYNRTMQQEFLGPLSAQEWQRQKASNTTGQQNQYRFRGDLLLMRPTPTAGQTCAFEYYSKFGVVAVDGTTYKEAFTADTDSAVFDEVILQAGLAWKWKAEKGFDYAEEFRRYEELFASAGGRDGTKRDISMDGSNMMPRLGVPVIVVPG